MLIILKRAQYSLSTLLIAIAILALLFNVSHHPQSDTFNADIWINNTDLRREMIDSLEQYHLKAKMKRTEVYKMLGEPEQGRTSSEDRYILTSRRGDNGLPYYRLEYEMDQLKTYGIGYTPYDEF